MKRVVFPLFLVLSLLVVGCGSGGGGGTTTTGVLGGGEGGGVGVSGPVGTVTVVLSGPGHIPSAPVLQDDNVTLQSGFVLSDVVEHGFRVTVSKYETSQIVIGLNEDDPPQPIYRTVTLRTYFNYGDNSAPGTITLKVPVGSGYLVEVVSFDTDPLSPFSALQLIRYGYAENVSINEGPNAIALNGRPFTMISDNTILFSHSQQITGGNAYTMKVTYNSKVPLRNTFNYTDSISKNFVMDDTNPYNIGEAFTRTAPVGVANDNIYFQGQFYIHDSMLSDAQQFSKAWKNYRLNAPAAYNNDIYQRLLLPGDLVIKL